MFCAIKEGAHNTASRTVSLGMVVTRGLGYHLGRTSQRNGCGPDWSLTISLVSMSQPMPPPDPAQAPAAPQVAPSAPATPAPNHIPERIRQLADISQNLWWSWQLDARELFDRIDRRLWEATRHNAVQFLRQVSVDRLAEHAQDPLSLERYEIGRASCRERVETATAAGA